MTKKIFKSIILAACGVMLACICLFMGVLYGYYGDQQAQELRRELALAAAGVEQQGMDYLNALEDISCRLTWVDGSGNVLYDSTAEASSMENHASREEIAQALQTGSGESARYSSTLTQQTRYYARRLTDGSVLRVSDSRMTAWALVLYCIQPICAIFAVALILSGILADRMTRNIISPLEAIDLDKPLEGDSYEELSPMLTRLEHQHRQIREQQSALEERQREFQAVVDNMAEGLVLLDSREMILSINPAALRFFGGSGSWTDRDFLALERDYEIGRTIRRAEDSGAAERIVSRGGREYRFSASRVEDSGKTSGVVILIFDVTDAVFAERNRREFTANVSHELKTPLQSIMGSAELLEGGLVRQEDVPEFLRKIREESARLVTLIDDIIHLSQLDEGAPLQSESVNLAQLSQEEIRSLTPAAEAKSVRLNLEGDCGEVFAPRPLVHEIVYNLLDNAIRYNVPGGSATVRLADEGSSVRLEVADTGIGIPEDQQGRVFERFYRVDKSRSRQLGGTGLGLSIVKHAVLDLGGTVTLQSRPGEGTTVTVILPSGK